MQSTQWGPDLTIRDICRKASVVGSEDVTMFYREMLHVVRTTPTSADSTYKASLNEVIVDYLYERYGRPKWFVDREVTELLSSLTLEEDDLTGIFFPHDVFSLVFERGTMLNGWPVRSIRSFRPKSKSTWKFLDELPVQFQTPDPILQANFLNILVDCGESALTGQHSWDTSMLVDTKLQWRRPLDDRDGLSKKTPTTLTADETDYLTAAARLLASALMYYSARPDWVAEYTLPRSCRYNYRGDRTLYRRMLTPRTPHIAAHDSVPTGRTVAGHWRGWVLRILRHERYHREADGSYRTVLVEPTAVKGGPERA